MKTLFKVKLYSLLVPENTSPLNENFIDNSNKDNHFRLHYKTVSYDNYFLHVCVVLLFAKYRKKKKNPQKISWFFWLKKIPKPTKLSFTGYLLKCISLFTDFIFGRNRIDSYN